MDESMVNDQPMSDGQPIVSGPSPEQQPMVMEPRRNRSKIVIIILAVLCLALAGLATWLLVDRANTLDREPEDTSQTDDSSHQSDNVFDRDFEQALFAELLQIYEDAGNNRLNDDGSYIVIGQILLLTSTIDPWQGLTVSVSEISADGHGGAGWQAKFYRSGSDQRWQWFTGTQSALACADYSADTTAKAFPDDMCGTSTLVNGENVYSEVLVSDYFNLNGHSE